jgi:hypothetical protein
MGIALGGATLNPSIASHPGRFRLAHQDLWRDVMNRFLGIFSATILALLILVPAAAAAGPWDLQDEHLVLSTGGDITLAEGQRADVLVVVDGTATIEGDAGSVLVINGTVNFVGSETAAVVAIRGHVTLDAASTVDGDVVTMDSVVDSAVGASITGETTDVAADLGAAAGLIASAVALVYVAFVISAIAAAVALAGLGGRQVRRATATIGKELVTTLVVGFIGLVGFVIVAALSIATVVGAPLGLGLLLFLLPVLLVGGYLVAGIWIGDMILARTSPGVVRERPYLAAVVGVAILGVIGIIPVIGGIATIIGFGAIALTGWRAMRRPATSHGAVAHAPAASPAI